MPIGARGEIAIGGAGLARGYLGRPGLTAESFVPDPFAAAPGGRLYRSGDLARHGGGGAAEFRGRVDDQVKLRGLRIEPGEIAARLGRHPALEQAVVLARPLASGNLGLVAYVVLRAKAAADAAELRRFLESALPDFMVPSAFVTLDALPLTANLKVDRAALSRMPLGAPPLPADQVASKTSS